MKNILTILLGFIMISALQSQTITGHSDFPSSVTWPFLWDITTDKEGNLYTCSERGEFFKKSNGQWSTMDLELPISDNDIRRLAIDNNGIVWAGTESGLVSYENGTISIFNSSNSPLPADYVRLLVADGNKLWMYAQSNGLILKEGNNFTNYNSSNSQLPSDFISDLAVADDGTLYIAANEMVSIVKGNQWTNYNFNDLFGFGTRVNKMFVDHRQDVWFGTDEGVIKYNKAGNSFENLKTTYGENNYSAIYFTPTEELWLGELFEGIHFHSSTAGSFYFHGDTTAAPSQVFDFLYYQDTMRVVGNIGATVTGLTIDFADLDDDGFPANVDCDDSNPDVNPDATEIPYNGLDDDCNPLTLDDDLDEDGFAMADDCDDTNSSINPNATEIPYNNIDEDCNPMTFDDDLDEDGFVMADDCDDTNADINPDAIEIANNNIDEDCDGSDLISSINYALLSQVKVYPNPVTTDVIFIKNDIGLKLQYRIFDHLGKLQGFSTENVIDISVLNAGAYLLEITDIDTRIKVVKKMLLH